MRRKSFMLPTWCGTALTLFTTSLPCNQMTLGAEVEHFLEVIHPAASELKHAASDYSDLQNELMSKEQTEVVGRFERARTNFAELATQNWPFSIADKDALEATTAYRDAVTFEEDMYHTARVTREVAVAAYVAVAEKYPGTVAHDQALYMAANLYVQRLFGEAKPDYAAAEVLFRQLASNAEEHYSSYVLWAEENIAGLDSNASNRMRARSDFYLDARAKSDEQWVRNNVLIPTPKISMAQYIRNVEGTLVQIQNVKYTSGKNMVADAMMTPKPAESLKWLKERHAGDPFVEAEVKAAMGHLVRVDFDRDVRKFYDASVDDSVLLPPLPDAILASANHHNIPGGGTDTAGHAIPRGSAANIWTAALLLLVLGGAFAIASRLIVRRRTQH